MKLKAIQWYFFDKQKYYHYKMLQWLIKAKQHYIQNNCAGMCEALTDTIPYPFKYIYWYSTVSVINVLKGLIANYRPEYFNTHEITEGEEYGFWWPTEDRESRIKAFNKLINDYESLLDYYD